MGKLKGIQTELFMSNNSQKRYANQQLFTASGISDSMKQSLSEIANQHGFNGNISALLRALAVGELEIKSAQDYIKEGRVQQLEQDLRNLTVSFNRMESRLTSIEDSIFAREVLS